MPLDLPPVGDVLDIPPKPHDPPTVDDLAKAARYVSLATFARQRNKLSDQDLVNAEIYKFKLYSEYIRAQGRNQPLGDALQVLADEMNRRFNRVDEVLAALTNNVDKLKTDVEELSDNM